MSIDAYSPCPGGTGKKIKFCCNDLLPELQAIDRMIEGEQYTACLQHIDRLMEKESNRGRACLLALKCTALNNARRDDELKQTVADFLTKHPDNQIALAESAQVAFQDDVLAGFALLLRAMRAADGKIELQTYQAMGLAAALMYRRGFPLPARALVILMLDISSDDRRAQEMLSAFHQDRQVPLLLRDALPLFPAPDDAPWKARYEEAWEPYNRGDWLTSVERLAALAADLPDVPLVWHALAALRGWTADNPGAIEALRRYSALRAGEENGLEDAAEAEASAMFLSDDPLGDRMEMLKVEWTVKDAERVQEALLSSPRCHPMPFDPARFTAQDTPPPKGAFMLRDRPMPESAAELSLENVPQLLGHGLLFGRQTDREARLEVVGAADDTLPAVAAMIAETAGDAVEPEPKREPMGKMSASRRLLHPLFDPPDGATEEQLESLVVQHIRRCVLDCWPDLKLGVLDGRTPREAAADPACRARLLGAILVFEQLAEEMPGEIDFNELRGARPANPGPDRSARDARRGNIGDAARAGDCRNPFRRGLAGCFRARPGVRRAAGTAAVRPGDNRAARSCRLGRAGSGLRGDGPDGKRPRSRRRIRRSRPARGDQGRPVLRHVGFDGAFLQLRPAQRQGDRPVDRTHPAETQ